MNADRIVVSTHRFVTTPQTISSVTARPRSSGSSEVHWKASKRTLSTTRSSGPQPSSSTTSASQKPAGRPVHVPGEHDGDRGPAGLGDRDGSVADGVLRALQAHADLAERAVRVA